jgi:L-amino acid N-acyltransferase YncA
MIRQATESDAAAIAEIYNYYIQQTVVTFEETSITPADILNRMTVVASLGLPWLVATENDTVNGYAYAAKWRDRTAYRNTVETTVYLSPQATGKGWGSQLYEVLLKELKAAGLHVAIGGITLPNPASVALHERFGMEKVAHFKEVGYKFEKWLDVGYWQVTLNDEK